MPYASAFSTRLETSAALEEVCEKIRGDLGSEIDLLLVFFSSQHAEFSNLIASKLQRDLNPRSAFGCAGEGIVSDSQEFERKPAISLWAAQWPQTVRVEPFHLVSHETPDGTSILGLPDMLVDGDPGKLIALILGDPFSFPATQLFLPRLNDDFSGLRVHGGMASGVSGPDQWSLLLNGEVYREGAVGVIISGLEGTRSIVSQGCRPIGGPMVITKAHGNFVLELGGKTPLDQMRSMFQQLPARDQRLFQQGPHVGLVINEYQASFQRGDFLVRNIMGVDRESGAMALADLVRTGQTLQFHVRDAEAADEDLRELLRTDKSVNPQNPKAGLLFTCNGRGSRLFATPNHDVTAIQAERGPIPLAGFFAAGEFGPIGGRNFVHGFTASALLFDT